MKAQKYNIDFGGRDLEVTLGELAQQSNGSCQIKYGDTTVLVTAVMSREPRDTDFFPLMVDYEEKFYAAGKIKGSRFIKREGRPSDEAVLTARLIDRSIRPRFDHRIRNEVQIVVTVLSFDGENDPDVPALFGASLALMVSDIPFNGPVSGVRVGRNGKIHANPSYKELETSDYDIFVAGTDLRINMLETGANIVPEEDILEGIAFGFEEVKRLNKFQKEIAQKASKKKSEAVLYEIAPEMAEKIRHFLRGKIEKAMYVKDKQERSENLAALENELKGLMVSEGYEEHIDDGMYIYHEETDRVVHENILNKELRPDGRKLDEIRPISIKVGALPHTHGMGLFERGETQVMSVLTLAAPSAAQLIDTMELDATKRFMHHYGFPPFSVGETGKMGGTGRRDIGHGALAEKAIKPIIPSSEEFPYTIRVVSETLSSNGSSSMASVCGSSLALMDGGIPIAESAAGIAMGLMLSADGEKYKVLTDIQGPEDHHGDMDLKVAGTKNGVTAMQMDVKIEGVDLDILKSSLKQAKKARLEILEKMNKAIDKPRKELSPYAPRITSMKIDPEKIGAVIGPGGKIINGIIARTGAEIDIEQDGTVTIASPSKESLAAAVKEVELLVKEVQEGDIYEGTVVTLKDFGAFVEILPGQDGLLHVSEISEKRIKTPGDVLKIGQKVAVKVKKVDDYGKISLTMKF